MCSSDDIKDKGLLYRLVKQDSRNAAWLGNALGIDVLEQEGKRNTKNPGHAITKAAEYALGGYLGGLYGGGEAAAGAAAGGTALETGAAMSAEELAAQEAAIAASQAAGNGATGAVETGYTPSSLWNALKNASTENGTPLTQNLGNYGKAAGENVANGSFLNNLTSGGAGGKNNAVLAQQGLKMMFPEQSQQQRPAAVPMQGQQQPLPNMYAREKHQARPMGQYGTEAGNSLGFTEEQKRKLRELGYEI